MLYLLWHGGYFGNTQCYLIIKFANKRYGCDGTIRVKKGVKEVWGSVPLGPNKRLSRGWGLLPDMDTDEIVLPDGRQVPVYYCDDGQKYATWVKWPEVKGKKVASKKDMYIQVKRDGKLVKVPNTIMVGAIAGGVAWDNATTELMLVDQISTSYEMEQTMDLFDVMLGAMLGLLPGYYVSFVLPPQKVLSNPIAMMVAIMMFSMLPFIMLLLMRVRGR